MNHVLPSYAENQLKFIEDATHRCTRRVGPEFWQEAHHEAMCVRDIEELAYVCISLAPIGKRMYAEAMKRLEHQGWINLDQQEQSLGDAFESFLHAFERVHNCIMEVSQLNYTVDNLAEFEAARDEVIKLRESLHATWPKIDPDTLRRSESHYEAGEYVFLDDFLNELQGGHPAEHPGCD